MIRYHFFITDWVTEDLLEKVQKNATVFKRLGDPRFMQAINEFQSNPKEAMEKYANNLEVQTFLKEFCGLLGIFFSSIQLFQLNEILALKCCQHSLACNSLVANSRSHLDNIKIGTFTDHFSAAIRFVTSTVCYIYDRFHPQILFSAGPSK